MHGVVPSQERFDAHDRAGHGIDHRLVGHRELLERHVLGQLVGELPSTSARSRTVGVDELDGILSPSLRPVHRLVGPVEERSQIVALRGHTDAHRGSRGNLDTTWQQHGLANHVEQLPAAQVERLRAGVRIEEHRELVAGEAGGRLGRGDRGLDATSNRDQHGVAGAVSERIIDVLEVVEINDRYGPPSPVDRLGVDDLTRHSGKRRAIEQPGERIVLQFVDEPPLKIAKLRDRRHLALVLDERSDLRGQREGEREIPGIERVDALDFGPDQQDTIDHLGNVDRDHQTRSEAPFEDGAAQHIVTKVA